MAVTGKTVLITGSSHGIGAATALAFAREGCAIGVNYNKDPEGAEKTAAQVRELGADGRWVLRSHPSEREAARRWLQRGLDAHEAVGPGASDTAMLRDRLRIESSDEVPAGELRLARDD